LIPASHAMPVSAQQAQAAAGPSAMARRIGTIKAIQGTTTQATTTQGTTITLTPDSGPDVNVSVADTTRIVRIAPGEKDLKNATQIQLQDLQVGDRILAGGRASGDTALTASTIVVLKRSDVEAQHEQQRQDWQKRGVGGLVSAVDPATGTITISVTGFGGTKKIAVQISRDTVIRRYAPDSVKFDDAKTGTLQDVQPGDQLRARGNRSADGMELTADEIVSGTFRNVAGTVISIDASSSTVSVQDLLSKKAMVVKVTADSQLRQLPEEMARRIAMRLKGAGAAGGAINATSSSGNGSAMAPGGRAPGDVGSPTSGMGGGPSRSGGAPDFQQMLNRMPVVTLTDLRKGEAVLIVATQGTSTAGGTIITLLTGVEPLLQAAPTASSAAMLTPWSLGAPSGGDAASQ